MLLLVLPFMVAAQSSCADDGDEAFGQKFYQTAIKAYEKCLKGKNLLQDERARLLYMIAECHRLEYENELAKQYYEQALQAGYNQAEIYLNMGDITLKLGDYEKAKTFFQTFLQYRPGDRVGLRKIEACDFAMENLKKMPEFTVRNEVTLNTKAGEYSITYMPNQTTLGSDQVKNNKSSQAAYDAQFEPIVDVYYDKIFWAYVDPMPKERVVFTSSRQMTANRNVDFAVSDEIYEALYDKKGGRWDPPKKLGGGVNTSINNNGFFSYNDDLKRAYFERCNSSISKKRYCNIFYTDYDEKTKSWSEAKKFDFATEDYKIGQPSLSSDGRTLYFVSDLPGGYGGADLYKIKIDENGVWGKPVNLGPKINTESHEGFPHIFQDSILYFASEGHIGMGGLDIFYSRIDANGDFTDPTNLGVPVNSTADDFAIVFINDNSGFFCSNRIGGDAQGEDDIYSFRRKPKPLVIRGNVRDKYNTNFQKITVKLKSSDGTEYTTETDSLGNYEFKDLDPTNTYNAQVIDPNILSQNVTVDPNQGKDTNTVDTTTYIASNDTIKKIPDVLKDTTTTTNVINTDINVLVYDPNKENEIKNIYWDFDKWDLRDISQQELKMIASILKGHPDKFIIINSYADERGTVDYNNVLSQKRAKTVVDYLIHHGVGSDRLLGRGFGKSQPVVANANNENDHQLNRRTTFEVKDENGFMVYLSYAGIYKKSDRFKNPSITYYGSKVADLNLNNAYIDVEFRVQFVATRKPVNPDFYQKIEKAIPNEPVNQSFDPDGFYRYWVGKYVDYQSAKQTADILKKLGYDTYIAAFNAGKRINIRQAHKLLRQK